MANERGPLPSGADEINLLGDEIRKSRRFQSSTRQTTPWDL